MQKNILFLSALLLSSTNCVTWCSDEHVKAMDKEQTRHHERNRPDEKQEARNERPLTPQEKGAFKSYARWASLVTIPIAIGTTYLCGKSGKHFDDNKSRGFILGIFAGSLMAHKIIIPTIHSEVRQHLRGKLRPNHTWIKEEKKAMKKVFAAETNRVDNWFCAGAVALTAGWLAYKYSPFRKQ